MTAPAFRSVGTLGESASGTTVTPGAPSGAADGDVLILASFSHADSDTAHTLSANATGWTKFVDVVYDAGTSGKNWAFWWYRVSGTVPTMPTVSQSDPDTGLYAQVAAYSGVKTSGTPYEGLSNSGRQSNATMTGRAVTTTGGDRLVVNVFSEGDDVTSTPASGWTEDAETGTATGDDALFAWDSIVRATAGTEGAPTRSVGAAKTYLTAGFALIPAVGGGPTGYLGSGNVQFVSITIPFSGTSATATINAVGSTAIILSLGWEGTQANNPSFGEGRVTLTNSTTVTATRTTSSASNTCIVKCVVIDATTNLVKSAQFKTISLSSTDLSNTTTIDPVDANTSVLHCLGWNVAGSSNNYKIQHHALSYSGTTVTATRQSSGQAAVVGFVMIEFEPTALNSNVQSYSKSWTNSSTSTTQAISSVDPDKSILIWAGDYANDTTSPSTAMQKAVLTNGTTVTIDTNSSGSIACLYNFFVVEFASGVLNGPVQRSTTTLSGVNSNTSTINSVDTTKAGMTFLRNTSNAATGFINNVRSDVTLTNGTTVTSSRSGVTSNVATSWEVFEFSSGASPITGTASVTTDNASAVGSAAQIFTGAGSVSTGDASASGSATETFTGSTSVTTGNASAAGSAVEIFTGTASVVTGSTTATGSATVTANVTGTASVTTANATASGSAAERFIASGSVSTANTTASGSATTTGSVTGTVAVTTAPATASGAAREIFSASGAVTTANTTASGLAREIFTGSASVTTAPATASGVAREIFAGSASTTTGNVTASGSASERFIATVAATTDAAAASGTATVTNSAQMVTGTAAVTTEDATATGSAFALLQGFEEVFYIPADDRTYRVPADL